jgi:hypothetical protein
MRDPTRLPGRPAYLAALPDFLFQTDASRVRYVVKACLVQLAGSLILTTLWHLFLVQAPGPQVSVEMSPWGLWPVVAALLVVIALVMAGLLVAVERYVGPGPAVVVIALVSAIFLSLTVPSYALVLWWSFLIMGIAFLTWRPHGFFKGVLLISAMHALETAFDAIIFLLVAQLGL